LTWSKRFLGIYSFYFVLILLYLFVYIRENFIS
jgi:hypothetical protein